MLTIYEYFFKKAVKILQRTCLLAGPIVWDGPVQGNPVTQECIVAVLLLQVFGLLFLLRSQCGRKATFALAFEALNKPKRFGQTC